MLRTTRNLLEMIRFSHTLFALPFALLAAMMAWHLRAQEIQPVGRYAQILLLSEIVYALGSLDLLMATVRWQELTGILICMVGARSAAMAFNRLADRRIDAENPRTKMRHLPAGTLSVASARWFALSSSA